MIAKLLKEKTREHHDEAERQNYANKIMDGSLTLGEYEQLLFRNYWLNFHIEGLVETLHAYEVYPDLDLEKRSKVDRLRNDLHQIGVKEIETPAVDFPDLNIHELLGGLYVTEGSTLGGKVIQDQLVKNKNFSEVKSFSFFNAYDKKVGERWKSFMMGLERYSAMPEHPEEEVIQGAVKTFDFFLRLSEQ